MIFEISSCESKEQPTARQRPNESLTKDRFHGIDELVDSGVAVDFEDGVALEHDGNVYSCDHYVYPEYRLARHGQKSLAEMVFSPRQIKFGYAKSETLPRYCRDCSYLKDCWGECPKN